MPSSVERTFREHQYESGLALARIISARLGRADGSIDPELVTHFAALAPEGFLKGDTTADNADVLRDMEKLGVNTAPYRSPEVILQTNRLIAARSRVRGLLLMEGAYWSPKRLEMVLKLDISDGETRGILVKALFAPAFFEDKPLAFSDFHKPFEDNAKPANVISLFPSRETGAPPMMQEDLDDFMVSNFRFCLFELSQLFENQLWILDPENRTPTVSPAVKTRLAMISGLAELNGMFDYTEHLEASLRAFMRLFMDMSNDEELRALRERDQLKQTMTT